MVLAVVLIVGVSAHFLQGKAGLVSNTAGVIKSPVQSAVSAVVDWFESLYGYIYEYDKLMAENESLKAKAARSALGDVMDKLTEVKGVKLLATKVPGVDMNGLRDLGDSLKEKIGEGVILLASEKDGKVNLVAMATDEAQKRGAHAGNLIKGIAALVGGGGGGRPNMAQAGGKNPAGIEACLEEAKKVIESQLA